MTASYWIETLGCPKNSVDSDLLASSLLRDGYVAADDAESADLVVVNTCAFIDAAREESIETILDLSQARRAGSRLVVTGCLAARSGAELAEALPEVDLVADVGVPVQLTGGPRFRRASRAQSLSLMELERPPVGAPWAYVRVAEGCDRNCGFCAIPSFRGRQASRPMASILSEVERLDVAEIVLVSQDLGSYGKDLGLKDGLATLVRELTGRVERVRLLYLYPTSLTDGLIDTICSTGVPYFDLSLQHVSSPHLRRMRRAGSGAKFLSRIERIRQLEPSAAFRSSFIVGYPGETEEDHDQLLDFLRAAELDWVGLFAFSEEEGTYAAQLDHKVDASLAMERLREAGAITDVITSERRRALVGEKIRVMVDRAGVARSHREAPEIDGVIRVPESFPVGSFHDVVVTAAEGPDLIAGPLAGRA